MKEKRMNEPVKELVAIGASVGAHCQPCLEYHIQAAIELGVTADDIRQAVEVGHMVEKGAMAAMKKFSAAAVEEILSAARFSKKQPEAVAEESSGEKVLKIYDPAMCCSSGVCGPNVDPALAQFAGTLKFISAQPGVRVERYNLGQQPQAFVANEEVKSMLGNGGEKKLPFIFVNDQLWLEGRYPSRDELLQALKINSVPVLFRIATTLENAPCCGDGGCC
ncbi:arsenite efflux transporter metallochaperone ArsD [Desulfoferrobacter suflitae]|uniref:arsenite efflux transporter metallochaperone ArsD n=1 Tax=Desulfoferrobacter suflitae TaxID=2865782 RepID=UPI0021640EC7|nr:arsenite efflux transporter metallochaperone ArsD [Desulfoferrobacter suflitae]MCK8603685.1 arsenite efflux transporter metallochaperone ArsD [Desulfoferrobacter suflitae]